MSWLAEGNTEAVSLEFQRQEVLWTYGHKVCGSLKVVSMSTKEHLSREGTKQQGEYSNSSRGAGPSSVFAHPEDRSKTRVTVGLWTKQLLWPEWRIWIGPTAWVPFHQWKYSCSWSWTSNLLTAETNVALSLCFWLLKRPASSSVVNKLDLSPFQI